jgi:hypothetical protein
MAEAKKKTAKKPAKKADKKPEKKARWSSVKRRERDLKKNDKVDKPRWTIYSKKVKELKEELRKKRRARKANRLMLVEKGVIKQK